jgi:hypothetical protein
MTIVNIDAVTVPAVLAVSDQLGSDDTPGRLAGEASCSAVSVPTFTSKNRVPQFESGCLPGHGNVATTLPSADRCKWNGINDAHEKFAITPTYVRSWDAILRS